MKSQIQDPTVWILAKLLGFKAEASSNLQWVFFSASSHDKGGRYRPLNCMSRDKGRSSHENLEMPLLPLLGSPSLLSWFARSFCFFLLVASSNPGGPLLGPVALAPPDILSRLVASQSAPGSATASGSGLRRFLPGPAILATLCSQILQQGTNSLMKTDHDSLPKSICSLPTTRTPQFRTLLTLNGSILSPSEAALYTLKLPYEEINNSCSSNCFRPHLLTVSKRSTMLDSALRKCEVKAVMAWDQAHPLDRSHGSNPQD